MDIFRDRIPLISKHTLAVNAGRTTARETIDEHRAATQDALTEADFAVFGDPEYQRQQLLDGHVGLRKARPVGLVRCAEPLPELQRELAPAQRMRRQDAIRKAERCKRGPLAAGSG